MDITKLISPQNADERRPSHSSRSSSRPDSPPPHHQQYRQHLNHHQQHHHHHQQQPTSTMAALAEAAAMATPGQARSSPPPPPLNPNIQSALESLYKTIEKNHCDLRARLEIIALLHDEFVNYASRADPRTFPWLNDLLTARKEVDEMYAIKDDFFVEWIQEKKLTVRTVEDFFEVLELCRRSVNQEYGSPKLWCIYGESIKSLHDLLWDRGITPRFSLPVSSPKDIEEYRAMCTWENVLNVWANAAEATCYRLNDSSVVWDVYIELLEHDLEMSATPKKIENLRSIFISRLQVPHRTWDATWGHFSRFITTYYNADYEAIMVEMTSRSSTARSQWEKREFRENTLQRAFEEGDRDALYRLYMDYIEWELEQDRRHRHTSFELICGIYERALVEFPCDVGFWSDYILFLAEEKLNEEGRAQSRRSQAHRRVQRAPASLTPVLDRATRHCPWSGTLWSQSILNAEREGNGFDDISRIKHRATHTGVLESAGVNELAKVWTTYCSYLHRRAFQADSTDEHHGMAEVGIRSALEDIRRIYDRNKRSVPAREALLRLERVYIQYLSDSGSYDTARERFKQLIGPQGHSYDFWLSYYHWELQCWAKFSPSDGTSTQRHTDPPGYATAVLKHALERAGTDLDWPEKIFSTYFAHCEDYETADELQAGAIAVRRALRELQKRRRKEMAARFSDGRAALAAPADAPVHPGDLADAKAVVDPVHQLVPDIKLHHAMKRKYGDGAPVSAPEVGAKRSKQQVFKQEEEQEQTQVQEVQVPPKRDRENASVIARGLPANVTADQVTKRFFRDCGRTNSLKFLPIDTELNEDGEPTRTAVVEFETHEDALCALTRDQKKLNGYVISVQPYVGTTLYVTNFPPEKADKKSIMDLFSPFGDIVEVRLPSLRYNTHRRFCYVQFVSSEAAHQAVEKLHGMQMQTANGKMLQLVVQVSDPTRKHQRSDADREGREIHVSNLVYSVTEDELRMLFEPYGTLQAVKVPRKVDGSGKGFGFVLFEKPEEAQRALAMEGTAFKDRILHVKLSSIVPVKPAATTIVSHVPTGEKPAKPEQGESKAPEDKDTGVVKPDAPPPARTIALMNVPDTVNDARIRVLAEQYGPLIKVTVRPDHAGAKIEFANEPDAGRAALALDGTVLDGQTIRVGSVSDMLAQQPPEEIAPAAAQPAKDKGAKQKGKRGGEASPPAPVGPTAPFGQSAMPIRRPGAGGGRRGGLGTKRARPTAAPAAGRPQQAPVTAGPAAESDGAAGKKSNSDFKALVEQSRRAAPPE